MPFQHGPGQPGLTPVQHSICAFVWNYFQHTGYSPAYREIGAAVGLASTSTVKYEVDALKRKGFLTREPGQPRTLAVTSRFLTGQWSAAGAPPGADETAVDDDWIEVQVAGRVAAGSPLLILEDTGETLGLSRRQVGHGDLFALRVTGDSMTGAAIIDGDLAVIRRQPTVENGEIAAAVIVSDVTGDPEVTLKTFRVSGGHAWLMPQNPVCPPIPGDSATILGKYVFLCRRP
jgi:repressor LexA